MWAADVSAMSGYHAGVSAAAAQLSPAAGLQDSLAGLPNLGVGNKGGTGNIGSGNTGSGNIGGGNGNTGTSANGNIGSGKQGNSNFGSGNMANASVGFGNIGNPGTSPD